MDELTRERYLFGVPERERYATPTPRKRRVLLVDWAVVEERRKVLDEGLKKYRPGPLRGGTVDRVRQAGPATKGE